MRKTVLFLAVFALAGSLFAADPIIGTWKLNMAKSKFSPLFLATLKQPIPEKTTDVYRELDNGQIEFAPLTWPQQGGVAKVPKDYPFEIIQALIAPGDWYAIFLKGGKQVRVIHKVISRDGKTMHQTITGLDPDGKPNESLAVHEKR